MYQVCSPQQEKGKESDINVLNVGRKKGGNEGKRGDRAIACLVKGKKEGNGLSNLRRI